jgi:hypothetical protein
MSEDPKVINLGSKEIDPQEEASYQERIRAARAGGKRVDSLKGSEPPGGVRPQMPDLRRPTQESPAQQGAGVQPRPPGSPVLRPETKQQLADAQKAAAELDTTKKLDEAKLAEDARQFDLFEALDFDNVSNQVDKILDNKRRRKAIEERCEPMNFEDLLMRDEVRQRVPILPGQFEPLYRSITPLESLYLKQRMSRETTTTDQYLGEKYNLMLLTCCLVDINKALLPDHRKMKGDGSFDIDDALFDEKFQSITRKSGYIVADLSVNYLWFDIRVRKLINPDDLKNG